MTEFLFTLTFLLAAPFWAMMIFLPGWRLTHRVIGSPLIVIPVVVVYLVLLVPILGEAIPAVTSPEMAVLQELLSTAAGTAVIWAHVIAFDLFVGRWMYLDSRERGISPWLTGPQLALTILFAPVGLLVYLAVRSIDGLRRASGAVSSPTDRAAAQHPVTG